MITIYTNMDWKAAAGYNPANGTAGEPNPETGIVSFEEGKTARTDNVEIVFTNSLIEKDSENYKKVQSHIASLKGTRLLKSKNDTQSAEPTHSSDKWTGRFYRKTVGADGSTFMADYVYDRKAGKDYRRDYLSGMRETAENDLAAKAERANTPKVRKDTYVIGEGDHAEICRRINIRADIAANFSTASTLSDDLYAVDIAFSAALKEIEQNIADGKANPTEGLKPTVTVNGTEWNFAELLKTVDEINKSFDYFETHITMDYPDYARLGASRAKVTDWAAANLSKDKQELVARALDARTETYILREREALEAHRKYWDKPGMVMPEEKAEYYETAVISASNKEVREKIMELFEKTDYNSPAAVTNTVNKYRNIMSPAFLAFGASVSALPEYLNSAVNDIYKYIAGLFGEKTEQLNFSV